MDFEKFYKSIIPTEEAILEAVDEYTLYCYYTERDSLAVGGSYPCPFRKEGTPSWSFFRTDKTPKVEYYWKDHTTGDSGNIFKLIQKIWGLRSSQEVFAKINDDFGLGYELPDIQGRKKISIYGTPKEAPIKITIAEIPLTEAGVNFWKQFDIGIELLNEYNVSQIKWYWSIAGQDAPSGVDDPTFAYRIGEYYQIYSPYALKYFKFRNNLPENYFFGYLQLPLTGDTLVIDKSCKDVIFCRRIGLNAVAGKSETTLIPEKKMLELKGRFKEIYLMLDSDDAGKAQTEKYMAKYPWLKPRFLTQAKDKTDLCKLIGIDNAEVEIKKLLI